ncbi:MAG: hypothetical protein IJG13_16595 [Kiritimatiellae bacterium]|nr:hypothetical protein [Kiritimatiellia bacterium]
METRRQDLPPGWHYDDDTGAIMRDVIHRMGRRCFKWNYYSKGVYMITMTLADRSKHLFGRLVGDSAETAAIELSELGRAVDSHLRRISEFTSEIEILGAQLMPEHLHTVLRAKRRMAKPLGIALRGFKGGASQLFWRLAPPEKTRRWHGERTNGDGERTNGERNAERKPLFAEGYVDNILGDEQAVESALRYLADNPRRLWEKRAHPELFKVLREARVRLDVGKASATASAGAPAVPTAGFFAAIGNLALLDAPNIFQVQCSRSFFEYRRASDGSLLKDAPPAVETREFIEKRDGFLEAAEHGAVLISPCISHGEREIARHAFEKGLKVVTLANKGFNPLYKPGGRLFDQCADGNLLMLAPAAWPYLPGEKKMTRVDACVLNRIAQWLSGAGAVEIKYRGAEPHQIDRLAREALKAE